jgi:hypothetical protein
MDRPSHAWKQRGRVSIWRYVESTHNFPGWHFTADEEGAESLALLVSAFEAEAPGASRAISVIPPSTAELGVPNNRRSGVVVPEKVRLLFHQEGERWHLAQVGPTLEFNIGDGWMPPLRKGIEGVTKGIGDYCIGARPEDQKLWFWWQPSI